VSEFQLPAQANPLLAIVTTAELLDWYETVSVIAVPAFVFGDAVNVRVVPISIEA
jgi:hypothetical protein